ncbi:MAG: hypothetical protein IJA31_02730 [Clostridia bacterium]|nr:hypothetical protein [Clostridia bacterium]
MDKNTLIDKVKALAMEDGTYCVLAGGAMLFYGLRAQTSDIDLHVNEQAFAHLLATQKLVLLDEERRHYAIGEDIELYVTSQEDIIYKQCEGVCIQTPQAVLALKKRLNREKDQKDIFALEEYIKSE